MVGAMSILLSMLFAAIIEVISNDDTLSLAMAAILPFAYLYVMTLRLQKHNGLLFVRKYLIFTFHPIWLGFTVFYFLHFLTKRLYIGLTIPVFMLYVYIKTFHHVIFSSKKRKK